MKQNYLPETVYYDNPVEISPPLNQKIRGSEYLVEMQWAEVALSLENQAVESLGEGDLDQAVNTFLNAWEAKRKSKFLYWPKAEARYVKPPDFPERLARYMGQAVTCLDQNGVVRYMYETGRFDRRSTVGDNTLTLEHIIGAQAVHEVFRPGTVDSSQLSEESTEELDLEVEDSVVALAA